MKLNIKRALKTNLLRLLLSTTLAVSLASYAMAAVKQWNPPVLPVNVKCWDAYSNWDYPDIIPDCGEGTHIDSAEEMCGFNWLGTTWLQNYHCVNLPE